MWIHCVWQGGKVLPPWSPVKTFASRDQRPPLLQKGVEIDGEDMVKPCQETSPNFFKQRTVSLNTVTDGSNQVHICERCECKFENGQEFENHCRKCTDE